LADKLFCLPGGLRSSEDEVDLMTKGSFSLENARLSPFLNVRDGARALEFYQAAFAAKVLMAITEGGVVAQLAVGPAEFWIADESPEHQNFSPETLHGSTARMALVVDDPDALVAQAVAAGATVVWPVEDKSYRWRLGRIVDPFGHHWEIGKPIGKS
jgi:PhnB protein